MDSFGVWAFLWVVIAIACIVWPLLVRRASTQVAKNRHSQVLEIFNQRRQDLEVMLKEGEIDQKQFEQLQAEHELSLLEDAPDAKSGGTRSGGRWVLVVGSILLVVGSLLFYWQKGAWEDEAIITLRDELFSMPESTPVDEVVATQQELVNRLQSSLSRHPDNVQNWYLLARLSSAMGDFPTSMNAFEQILQQEQGSGQIIAELAQVKFLASGNRITPEIDQLVQQSLSIEPKETTALGLAGISAYGKGDYQAAISYWEKAVSMLGPMSSGGMALSQGIGRAKELLNESGGQVVAHADSPDANALRQIDVRVSLGDSVKASPQDTVFVYARAWGGPKMPLAIQRITVADLPLVITLNDTMSMIPGKSIATVKELEVVARVSPSGSPIATAGDWQAAAGPVMSNAAKISMELTIENQL